MHNDHKSIDFFSSDSSICYYICTKNEGSCPNFSGTPSHESCQIIENTKALVETSPLSENAIKIWTKSQIVEKVPHFLIIRNNGQIEDYSLDPEASPPIQNYPQFNFPVTNSGNCGFYDPIKRRLYVKLLSRPELYMWNFDTQTPEIIGTDPVENRNTASCAVSKHKMVVYGGNEGKIIK